VGVGGPKQPSPYAGIANIDGTPGNQQAFGDGALAFGGGSIQYLFLRTNTPD